MMVWGGYIKMQHTYNFRFLFITVFIFLVMIILLNQSQAQEVSQSSLEDSPQEQIDKKLQKRLKDYQEALKQFITASKSSSGEVQLEKLDILIDVVQKLLDALDFGGEIYELLSEIREIVENALERNQKNSMDQTLSPRIRDRYAVLTRKLSGLAIQLDERRKLISKQRDSLRETIRELEFYREIMTDLMMINDIRLTSQAQLEVTQRITNLNSNLKNFVNDVMFEHQQEVEITRYPTIEAQKHVTVGKEFSVLISLTEEQITPEVKIKQGSVTEFGQLAMSLPEQNIWEIDVVLSAVGFSFRDNKDTAKIQLPREGDSTPALFYLTPEPISERQLVRKLYATLWYQGDYLAKIMRDITIIQQPGEVVMTSRMIEASPSIQTTSYRVQGQSATLQLQPEFSVPDLTVYIFTLPKTLSNVPATSLITIHSPEWLQPKTETFSIHVDFSKWLISQYGSFRNASRGLSIGDGEPSAILEAGKPSSAAQKKKNILLLKGMGRELYQKFAPPAFKNAFWIMKDKLGDEFDSIQIFTNDPILPWELMRPIRENNTDEQDFLGMDFRIARWHISQSTTQLDSPPQKLPIYDLVAIAPEYEGGRALEHVGKEISVLQEHGFRVMPGRFDEFFQFFEGEEIEEGIIHFAGHGTVQKGGEGLMEYSIQLEDGELDLMTVRGLFSGKMRTHPFFFLNACDIGQAHHVANFVDGWAPAVLEGGASGYIGGLWPLGDQGAAEFATHFYQLLTQKLDEGSVSIAEVLQETRKQFYDNGDPTFLAYVYYGDPDFRLTRP